MNAINTAKSEFEADFSQDQNVYQEYANSFESAAYEQAMAAIQLHDSEMAGLMNRFKSFDIFTQGGTNIINKYTLYTQHVVDIIQLYKDMMNYYQIKQKITSALDMGTMKPAEQIEVEKALADIESGEFESEIYSAYEAGTAEIIELDNEYNPVHIYIIEHKKFTEQINNITNITELDQFWKGYKSLYDQAIGILDAMAQIALPSQTPIASAIYQYRNAVMSSASALNKRAASKRASMCSIGDGWLFWIIVLILLLILGGACFYYRREGKSTRRKSSGY